MRWSRKPCPIKEPQLFSKRGNTHGSRSFINYSPKNALPHHPQVHYPKETLMKQGQGLHINARFAVAKHFHEGFPLPCAALCVKSRFKLHAHIMQCQTLHQNLLAAIRYMAATKKHDDIFLLFMIGNNQNVGQSTHPKVQTPLCQLPSQHRIPRNALCPLQPAASMNQSQLHSQPWSRQTPKSRPMMKFSLLDSGHKEGYHLLVAASVS